MQSNEESKIIQLLLARLERVSVDSYWAHRASGIRGALLRMLEEMDNGMFTGREKRDELVSAAYHILVRAAKEKR